MSGTTIARVIQRKRKSTNMAKEAADASASEHDDTSSDKMEVDPPGRLIPR